MRLAVFIRNPGGGNKWVVGYMNLELKGKVRNEDLRVTGIRWHEKQWGSMK